MKTAITTIALIITANTAAFAFTPAGQTGNDKPETVNKACIMKNNDAPKATVCKKSPRKVNREVLQPTKTWSAGSR